MLQRAGSSSAVLQNPAPAGPGSSSATPAKSQQQLVESCQGLVKTLAWKIHRKVPPQVELNDLIAYGQLGLVQAAADFDPNRGGQFTTYAYYRIRGAILDGLSQMSWFSRAAYHQSRYERMSNEVLTQNAVDESTAKSVNETSKPADLNGDAQWFGDLVTRLSVVYLATGTGEGGGAPELVDGSETPAAEAIAKEMRQKLAESIDGLPPAAKSLIRATYFEGVTMQEAGRRLGISKAWASRLHARTLEQLGRSLRRAQAGG